MIGRPAGSTPEKIREGVEPLLQRRPGRSRTRAGRTLPTRTPSPSPAPRGPWPGRSGRTTSSRSTTLAAERPAEVGRDVHEGVERPAGRDAGHARAGRRSARRTYSRRRANWAFIATTESCGPVIASSAAYWLTEQGLLVSWLWRSVMNFATGQRGDRPADPPAGHRVGLAHARDRDRPVGQAGAERGEAGRAGRRRKSVARRSRRRGRRRRSRAPRRPAPRSSARS